MVTVWVEGIDEINTVAAELRTAAGRIGQRGSLVLRASALRVEAVGKLFCPVDTGNLRGSIRTDFRGDGRAAEMTATIGPTAHYGGYVEWGTSRQPPQAYMGPALDRVAPDFIAAVEAIADPFGRG